MPCQAGLLRCRSKSAALGEISGPGPEEGNNWAPKSFLFADSFAVDYRSRKRIQI